MKPTRPPRNAFTLIELLVVIALVAMLAALLLPALSSARERAKQVTCASNQKQFGIGLLVYLEDWNGWQPTFYIFDLYQRASITAAQRQAWEREWPVGVRACPTTPMPRNYQTHATRFYNFYEMPQAAMTLAYMATNVPGPIDVPSNSGYALVSAQSIQMNTGSSRWDAARTLPLICDKFYFYSPSGGYNFTSHSGTSKVGWDVPYSPSRGQNSFWYDGHVEWRQWTAGSIGFVPSYPALMANPGSFQEGWVRVYADYYACWARRPGT